MISILKSILATGVLGGVLVAAAPDAGRDPIEGQWLGAAGFPQDRI